MAALVIGAIFAACCPKQQEPRQIAQISFPEPPIEIMTNDAVGMRMINLFNIIQLPDGGYRLYFSGFTGDSYGDDNYWQDQHLYYAESADGFTYEMKGKVIDDVVEQSVFLTGDKEKPFGLVGRTPDNGKLAVFLWTSEDGINFEDRVLLLKRWHDTQNVIVPRDGKLKLYTRVWQDDWTNRKNSVMEFSAKGERLSDMATLSGDYVYNSAACRLDDRYDVLFPTFFNNKYPGATDSCFLKCFVVDGLFTRELPCELNRWIEPDEKWVLVAPGFITIGENRYLAYNTRTTSHDSPVDESSVSRYKLIKVDVRYEGDVEKEPEGEKEVLFNGKNLDGWTCVTAEPKENSAPQESTESQALSEPTFSVRDGALRVSGEPFGYIRTEKKYSDYTLHVEWRWGGKRVDSGIFTFLQDADKVWPSGIQIQLRESDFGFLFSSIPLEGIEGPFFRKGPVCDGDPERADGSWNEAVISCKGGRIRAMVNGFLVNEAVADATEGYIGFQSEGGPIEFRNIYITR